MLVVIRRYLFEDWILQEGPVGSCDACCKAKTRLKGTTVNEITDQV